MTTRPPDVPVRTTSRSEIWFQAPNGSKAAAAASATQSTAPGPEPYIYMVGGRNRGKTLNTAERYSLREGEWEECPPLLEPRGSHGAAALDGVVYAIAGGGVEHNLGTCEALHVDKANQETWQFIAPMSAPRHALTVVAAGGCVYAVGGWRDGKECSNVVEQYSVATDSWTVVAPLQTPRKLHAAASFHHQIFVFGGEGNKPGSFLKSSECYDTETGRWRNIKPLPNASQACATALGDHIYIFMYGKRVVRYSPHGDTHTKRAKLPEKEWYNFCVVPFEGSIYAMGGAVSGKWTRSMWRYDPNADKWEKLADMRVPRRRSAAALVYAPAIAEDGEADPAAEAEGDMKPTEVAEPQTKPEPEPEQHPELDSKTPLLSDSASTVCAEDFREYNPHAGQGWYSSGQLPSSYVMLGVAVISIGVVGVSLKYAWKRRS